MVIVSDKSVISNLFQLGELSLWFFDIFCGKAFFNPQD